MIKSFQWLSHQVRFEHFLFTFHDTDLDCFCYNDDFVHDARGIHNEV